MSRDEHDRLRDIKDAISSIRRHLDRYGAVSAPEDERLLHDALSFQFVVIGEAVKHLSDETRAKAADVPWSSIAGLRDLIAHEYFDIDMSRILDIVEKDLPVLEEAVEQLKAEI